MSLSVISGQCPQRLGVEGVAGIIDRRTVAGIVGRRTVAGIVGRRTGVEFSFITG